MQFCFAVNREKNIISFLALNLLLHATNWLLEHACQNMAMEWVHFKTMSLLLIIFRDTLKWLDPWIFMDLQTIVLKNVAVILQLFFKMCFHKS